ncbi:helix-turn-helix transcriptional regulator [Robiginitalea sp. M366]|uniref:helix-turn-helix domain-containing protein n=1 Tax=Robiginitalea aestuariiviva TaxID=3036903 RepID=UPI00240D69E8|nr:helix-turn-helix transcriptional regulator [Robiginitalea aestuariiviva]MDG1572511.1 helix-turn-helix transcriptional regulator [Robiginitalea aestuariiviva]
MKPLKKNIHIVVECTDTGYSAYTTDLPVFTTGKDVRELYQHVLEALNLYYYDKGFVVTERNLKLQLDLQQFFQYYRVLNASFLAHRIGMSPSLLSQYVRGLKKPSARQTRRILEGIQRIGKELADLQFI